MLPEKPLENTAYYPSIAQLKQVEALMSTVKNTHLANKKTGIKPGFLARTDGFSFDQIDEMIETAGKHDPALQSRMISVSDLTPNLYNRLSENKNSIANWFEPLENAIEKQDFFKVPKTKIIRLPIELAQFIRLEYRETRIEDREAFNKFIFDAFELEDGKTYFIKTGNFSSKFQFANAKCSEPREMGEYFQVINNFAMEVGAGSTVDLTVREYIEDTEGNPTIYNGMPLRTEFRAFVDFDTKKVFGTVPYWDPTVMKNVLKNQAIASLNPNIMRDFETYLTHEDKLNAEFNTHVSTINKQLEMLIQNINLTGQYSIDVMKNGEDFYVIDMALMAESALVNLLPDHIYN